MAKFKEAAPAPVEEEEFAFGGDELTLREELYEIAEIYGDADWQEKTAKATKDRVKGPMLELMSEVVREEIPLARQVIEVTNEEASRYDYDYEKWAASQWPEWRVVGILPTHDELAEITLEENDALKKFEFVVNGKKYGRTIAMVGADFDAEGFYTSLQATSAEEFDLDPDAIVAALDTVTKEVVTVYTFNEKAAQKVIAEHPEMLPYFEEFTSIGVPQVRMIPIKEVKEEE